MIRHLTVEELPLCFPIARAFWKEGALPGSFREDVFVKTWSYVIWSEIGTILGMFSGGKLTGVLGAFKTPDINDGELVSNEAFWFVSPEHRGEGVLLLDAYERWSVDSGCSRAGMIHLLNLHPKGLSRLYEWRGYKATEVHYFKENK